MRVVCRAVERIDDPLPLAALPAHHDRFARFLGEYSVLRIVRTYPLDDQIFRGDVGFGNEIDVALVGDLRGTKTLNQQIARLARDVSSEIKHFQDNGILIPLARAVSRAVS